MRIRMRARPCLGLTVLCALCASSALAMKPAPKSKEAPTTLTECKVQAAFFQSSRYMLGYGKMVRSTYSGYDANRVGPYAEEMAAHIRGNVRGCLSWKVFKGVSNNGKTLDWAGLTLQKEAGGANGNEGNSPPALFFSSMRTPLSSLGIKPLFGVVDSNYFHNMSAPLVRHAFGNHRHAGAAPVKLLLQFDNHSDYHGGQAVPADIRCSQWIKFVSNRDPTYRTVDKALHLGDQKAPCGDFSKNRHWVAGGGEQVFAGAATLAAQLGQLVPAGQVADYYITVDRDIMINSATGWGDGPHTRQKIYQAVHDAIDFLQNQRAGSHLIGFDVTGLPEMKEGRIADSYVQQVPDQCNGTVVHERRGSSATLSYADYMRRANEDIATFYGEFLRNAAVNAPAPMPVRRTQSTGSLPRRK